MKKTTSFLIFSILLAISCSHSTHPHISPLIQCTLDKMIKECCIVSCEYPKTLAEFVSVSKEIDIWENTCVKDSVETTLAFLEAEKEHIEWKFSHPTLTTMDLTILYYDDTIYRKTEQLWFKGIDVALYSYNCYYLEYPASIEELIEFDSLSGCLHQGFYQCCDETFAFLLKNKDKISWEKGDGEILITLGEDTIDYQSYDSQVKYCDEFIAPKNKVFSFFDTMGRYAYSEETEKALKTGLTELSKNYVIDSFDQYPWHVVVFTQENGLQLFCNNDELSLETSWFHEVNDLLLDFCSKYGLGKVIFVSPSYL